MNNREFIESGILETYALGMCSDEEARRVETICARDPGVQAELDQIRDAINGYATSYSKTPKAATREKILAEITAMQETEEVTRPNLSFYNNRLSIAASLIVLSLSLLANIVLYNKWKAANNEVIALNSEKQQLADNLKAGQVKYETMSKDLAIMSDPEMTKVMMKGMDRSPGSMAMVYWNKKSKEVFLGLNKLPMPEQGKQYQLWAIVDGKPVDAGMITMTEGDSSLHRMKDFETAQAFAITLEPEGGVQSPTLSEMYVMGTTGI